MIIALTGEKLAGKGTVATYLAQYHEAQVLKFSQVLTSALMLLGRPNSRAELVKLGAGLRELYGDTILAESIYRQVVVQPHKLVVIDGMRYEAEFEIFKQLPNFHLLNVTAPLEVRYARTKQRSEKSDEAGMSLEEFTARESDVTEQGIAALQALADHTIHNDGSFADLYHQIDLWFATL